ncbi:MAG: MerR family transcriptional regulator [Rubrivivax sp.]|nr:MerR family transcriptional regulator [Rubrivivax sp.]
MADADPPHEVLLSIAAVERDTGLSKDTLRVWERRYGFPSPARDAVGERLYGRGDLTKLRVLKRLLDAGHRPGRVVGLPLDRLLELSAPLTAETRRDAPSADEVDLAALLAMLGEHRTAALRDRLARLLAQLGLARFTLEVIRPMTRAVGDAWYQGRLQVFEEHLYTELVQGVLRQAIAAVPQPGAAAARVLLTTVPGEPHGLGLLMAEAMLVLQGCHCLSLGVQTPLAEVPAAARAHRADAVALSFSALMSPRAVLDALVELRSTLPLEVQLWAGGDAPVLRRRAIEGVLAIAALEAIGEHAQRLRSAPAAAEPHPPTG